MPWTKKQQKVAEAVKHGWKPKGTAKGFTPSFADAVIQETDDLGRTKTTTVKPRKGAKR